MPVAVIENIALELLSRLEAMLDDSTYTTQVSEVVRPTRAGDFTPTDRMIVLTQGNSTNVPELSIPGEPPGIARRQVFFIRCVLMTDERSPDAIDDTMNQFVRDVIRAVTEASSSWYSFGGRAIDAEFLDLEYFGADGGIDGVSIPVAITYRVSEYDPSVSRV